MQDGACTAELERSNDQTITKNETGGGGNDILRPTAAQLNLLLENEVKVTAKKVNEKMENSKNLQALYTSRERISPNF